MVDAAGRRQLELLSERTGVQDRSRPEKRFDHVQCAVEVAVPDAVLNCGQFVRIALYGVDCS
ncbi:hypothetical protein HPO96_32330 [Kribbella sandramycini]|uniref:Uncharacterized protein n=1 Tax=Kribbella sandramycini TaxID=60450 RepID=A0A7Y4L5V3_9ACTN|nr:hypothetical protein [Kribbella sandramycini]MBB6565944.1 hypothetical protein [Kribbella sandramycini]NOL44950.1 hypothetical protein [Kribbella sandramycini]